MPASALRPSGSSSGGRGRLAGLWEKSPARSRSVGTIPFRLTGSCRRTFSKSTKKNVLFFFRGPPREKPYWSRTWSGFSPELKKSRASKLARCRSEEHTSELQSHHDLVCRLLLEK